MKKRKVRKDNLMKIATIILAFIAITTSFINIFTKRNIYNYAESKENYNIKISYTKTKINKLDNKVKKLIKDEKKNFLKEVKNQKNNKDQKYDFILEGVTEKYKDIHSVHITIYTFNGGNRYNRKDISYIYNKNQNKFINITDISKDEDSFKELSLISRHLINKYKEDKKLDLKTKDINAGTEPKKENYKNFYINKNGLTIVFTPYEIASWSDGEIKITIPWNKLNNLVKDEYKNSDSKTSKDIKIVPQKRDISKYKDKKLIAFTFDDGPNEKTTKILLDNLDKYDAKVTFFVLGSRVSHNEEVLKRAYQEGNDIASHTYSHRDLQKLKDKVIKNEIDKTNDIIKDTIGVEPIYLRPPYGSINDHIKNLTTMHTICWNVDSLDWKLNNRKKIKNEIVSHAGDGKIVLVHDIYEESVYGALLAMKELKEKGYNFVTITEMSKLKNVTLDYDKTYYSF